MTEEQIERLAVEHEAFGFGRVDDAGFSTHGFDPDGLAAFTRALMTAERERCAKMLDLTDSELLLMAGEMTAQELRTVKAVLGGLRARMMTGVEA